MKNILCFGDSNTWGYAPGTGARFDLDTRWTGVLQAELGADYRVIEDGAWLADGPYGVVHRIASAPGTRGAATYCLNWAFARCGNLRIDTHADNAPMQGLLRKLGFARCGRIYIADGSPREAFQKAR